MPMPKGHKSTNGYATIKTFNGGNDYRTIAEEMTSRGYKMNHATARNVFLSAMSKIAQPICQLQGSVISKNDLRSAIKDPRFQSGIAEILSSYKK